MTASLINRFPQSTEVCLLAGTSAHLVIKERRNLLRVSACTSPICYASPLRTEVPLYCNSKFRNINLIPFRIIDGVTLMLRTD